MGSRKPVAAFLAMIVGVAGLAAAAAAPKAEDLVGRWKATTGDPKEAGSFYSIMLLELKKDGTAALSNTMPDIQNKGKPIVTKATGKWKLEGDRVDLSLEKSEDGKQIPEDQRKLPLKVSADGKSLTNPDLGEVAFKKQANDAK